MTYNGTEKVHSLTLFQAFFLLVSSENNSYVLIIYLPGESPINLFIHSPTQAHFCLTLHLDDNSAPAVLNTVK